jgi:hypothetical protein
MSENKARITMIVYIVAIIAVLVVDWIYNGIRV